MQIIKCDICNKQMKIITNQNYWRNRNRITKLRWIEKFNLHTFTDKIKTKKDLEEIATDNEDICNNCYTRINSIILKEIETIKKESNQLTK